MKQRPPSTEPQRSPRPLRRLLGAGSVAALLFAPRFAAADDLNPVAPNILLLVDTSGSMDYKTGTNDFPACRYAGSTDTGDTSERSRWIELVEVMTGSVNDYECQKLDRNSPDFKTEFALGLSDPYDKLYPNPYHRPVNGTCVAGPGTLDPMNAALFPASAIKYHPFDNLASTCTFNQTQDGVLDSLSGQVRFGLMTFDTEPRPGTDVSGLWSYYLSSSRQGEPAGCLVPQDQEVGVRNASAPPWEGRAVGFGDHSPGSSDYLVRNEMIQKVLLATRPYGATPIAGMLDDAKAFLLNDTTPDPLNTSIPFGPSTDPALDKCRRQAVILLSDGQPNMDLRPFCEPDGCPYLKAEDIAHELKNEGIDTYVIGFALTKVIVDGQERSCASFAETDFDTSNTNGICALNPDDSAIQACCSLNRIAAAGGRAVGPGNPVDWTRAHFATNRDELRREIQAAIGQSMGATTRLPAIPASGSGFITTGSDRDFAVGFQLGASVEAKTQNLLWEGELSRQRYKCESVVSGGPKVPVLQAVSEIEGDYFARNLNASGPSSRTLFTVVGADPIKSDATMRPNLPLTVDDGVGTYSGTLGSYTSTGLAAGLAPDAIQVDDNSCDVPTEGLDLTATQCRDKYVNWWVGVEGSGTNHRCKTPGVGTCALVADFLHSVPRTVAGPPNALITDASYDQFRLAQIAAKRPAVVYAATNDGFLHAFKLIEVDSQDTTETMKVKSLESNELWGFIPPAVLPGVPSLYKGARQLLLDGQIAIKDVVATFDNSLTGYKYKLQRSQSDAQVGAGTWRTILVQSFGAKRPGYYALDVTDPVPAGGNGPKLLWQLITDKDGEQIFGTGAGSPLITTAFIGGFEVAVAVLPGGHAPLSTSGPCTRKTTDFANHAVYLNSHMPRTQIPCYDESPSQALARSLTVVRLDTGEILRTFRQDDDEVPALKARLVVSEAPLDAPITGQPVAFPSDTGAVADRVFVGDQDGSLWRLNMTSDNGDPADWTMDLFFDGFPGDGAFNHTYTQGQPIETPPIISVDRYGDLTVAFSTGRQEIVGGAPAVVNYVWSLTEKPSSDRTKLLPKVNWYKKFSDNTGQRVVGTMALFSSNLSFATMGVTQADSCENGTGMVWSMHYTEPNQDGPGTGGVPDTDQLESMGAATDAEYLELTDISEGGAFSGVTVSQQPTCANGGLPGDNEYFSYGAHTGLGDVQGGTFKLIIPIGSGKAKSGVNAQEVTLGRATGLAFDLESPAISTRVDSWASIVE